MLGFAALTGPSGHVVAFEPLDPRTPLFTGRAWIAMDGFALIIVMFDFEKDLQQASQDIRDKISEVRADLPPEMEEPILTRFDPNDLPIISLTLSSTQLSAPELMPYLDTVFVMVTASASMEKAATSPLLELHDLSAKRTLQRVDLTLVADFYERRISHVDPRDTWDRTTGRLYCWGYGPYVGDGGDVNTSAAYLRRVICSSG